jgi:hypothetical protein
VGFPRIRPTPALQEIAHKSRAARSEGVTDLYLAVLASRKGMTTAFLDTRIGDPVVEFV